VAGAGSSLIAFPDGFECGQVSVHRLVADGQAGLLFVMTMMCDNRNTAAVSGDMPQGAWFYATTSSLEHQQWSRPAVVANTLQYIDCSSGRFTGYYPSFFTPTQPPAHLGSTGDAIYLDGILTGARALGVRKFRITVGTPPPFEPLPGISCPP
jgi:hypothetical protein